MTVASPTPTISDTDAPAIGDYAVIGDGRSAALVSRDGSIDWLCWPRFDSPAVFCRLLDPDGGHWSVRPRDVASQSRHYLEKTNVIESTFRTSHGGVVRVTDFMPVASEPDSRSRLLPDHELVRIVSCDEGAAEVEVEYAPRPGFSRSNPRLIDKGKLGLRVTSAGASFTLHSDLRFELTSARATATRRLNSAESFAMILTYSRESPEVLPLLNEATAALERSVTWWREWSARCTYDGRYADAVLRSVLTLKLLAYPQSGAFLAAATTSLPERVGGELNWDYRFCWLRDASVIMDALCGTGYDAEAEAFAEWLLHATRLSQPKLKVVYDVHGNPIPRERALKHLAGYRKSKPVNVGNGARGQHQLDTYGEVVSAVAKLVERKGETDRETAKVLASFGRTVCKVWRDPDPGIWEDRGTPVVHTHSRLLCWVALDALVRLDERGLLHKYGREEFRLVREQIRQSIETESWIEAEQTYTSEPGRLKFDATLLSLALLNFEPASSPRLRSTFARLRRELGAGGPLLYRNLPDDGRPIEGAFGICEFWAVEFLAMGGGTLREACDAFYALLAYGNDVGLYAEEIDPHTGAAVGNFPQAFTHVGLINAALAIERRERAEMGPA